MWPLSAFFCLNLLVSKSAPLHSQRCQVAQKNPTKQNTKVWTYIEESNVVVDEVVDHANFLWGLSPSLEQAGGEDGGQFFARHVV